MKTSDISVELINHCGTDISIVNAARVSFHKESKEEVYYVPIENPDFESWGSGDMSEIRFRLNEKDEKLVKYLAKHKHTSPFNHAFLSFRVKAPIFVARQLVKHSYLPWNEVSRRYVTEEPEFYFPDYWRKAAENVKQGSSDEAVTFLRMRGFTEQSVQDGVEKVVEHALLTYNEMLEAGVCAEQARVVLPQNVMTEWVWSGTLFAFARMCKLRLDPHTQKETQKVAQIISNEVAPLFPVSWKALLEYAE